MDYLTHASDAARQNPSEETSMMSARCPRLDQCGFFRLFSGSNMENARNLIHEYCLDTSKFRECIHPLVIKYHGLEMPSDMGPHGLFIVGK